MGKITRLLVVYEDDTANGAEHRFINLPAMRRAVRPERLEEILDDLTFACQDVLARNDGQAPALPGLRRIK
jgi:hypothetical protein